MKHEIPVLDAKGLRQFGWTTGAIVAVLFGLFFPYILNLDWPVWPWIIFAILTVWALAAPKTLNPLYKGWMRLGLLLGKITTPIVLTLVFVITILPGAMFMRLLGNDPMRRKFDQAETYRVESRQPSMNNLEKPY